MSEFRLTPVAARDLTEIFAGRDTVDAAERVRQALLDAMRRRAKMPGMGHRRSELTAKPVLFWPVWSYEIIYRPDSRPLEIVGVLHGKRNLKRVLRDRRP